MHAKRVRLLIEYLWNVPLSTWALFGFLISYLLFFIKPIFLSAQVMQFFKYVPAIEPIGVDLKQMLSYSESWFIANQTPYIGKNLYPPLASVLFTPLLILNFALAFKVITLVNVLCYILITLVFPLRAGKNKQFSPLLMLMFVTGLFSYGFQFELERGQFNVIAMFFCFLAIWIYHNGKYRYLAYFLFIFSVQLKVYPFIFIVMFIKNWRDWKNNIKRFSALTILNLALFFVLGPQVFIDFVKAIMAQTLNPYIWVGNHSIRSFVTLASKNWAWAFLHPRLTQLAFLFIIAVCIFIIMLQCYRQKWNGINSYLLLACTIGALLIPSVSHDYKLSILAAPVAFLFNDELSFAERAHQFHLHIIFIVLTLTVSVSYSLTLFSYTNKPAMLSNNFPALFTMLLIVTSLSLLVSKSRVEGSVS